MRRYENRRGAMVTDKADREGDKSRNDGLERADGFMTPASNKAIRVKASGLSPPGIVSRFEPDSENVR